MTTWKVSVLPSVVTDSEDGNGLKHEKISRLTANSLSFFRSARSLLTNEQSERLLAV